LLRSFLKKEYRFLFVNILIFFILILFAVYQAKHINDIRSSIVYYNTLTKDLLRLESEYDRLKSSNSPNSAKGIPKNTSLFSLIDRVARNDGLSSNVVFIRPFTKKTKKGKKIEFVEIKLKNLSLKSLVKFLYDIEMRYKNKIFTKRIRVSKNKDLSLSVNAVFYTYR